MRLQLYFVTQELSCLWRYANRRINASCNQESCITIWGLLNKIYVSLWWWMLQHLLELLLSDVDVSLWSRCCTFKENKALLHNEQVQQLQTCLGRENWKMHIQNICTHIEMYLEVLPKKLKKTTWGEKLNINKQWNAVWENTVKENRSAIKHLNVKRARSLYLSENIYIEKNF